MSTPIVSGMVCLLLSENRNLSNVLCKKIIKSTAIDLNMDKNRQGWGMISPKNIMNYHKFINLSDDFIYKK